jgi:hypothetical protein
MLVQVIVTVLLFSLLVPAQHPDTREGKSLIRSRGVRLAMIVSLLIVVAVGVLWVGGDRLATRIEAARGEFAESEEVREGVRESRFGGTMRMIEPTRSGVGMGGYWAAIPAIITLPEA